MVTNYFLGANTPAGFYSLYHRYLREDDRLYIIKGSPGSGKSTFMKKLAEEMEAGGFETELIRCSGDPDSLDGVYFPELKVAYADGTAPHVLEPRYAGVTETYLNLGAGLDMEGLWEDREFVIEFNEKYKLEYSKAYDALAAAGAVEKGIYDEVASGSVRAQVVKKAAAFAKREFKKFSSISTVKERFTDALTCRGWIRRYDTIDTLAEDIYLVEPAFGLNWLFVETVAAKAMENNWNVILCRDALYPTHISHVIIPQAGVAVVSRYGDEFPDWNARTIRLDSIPGKSSLRASRELILERTKMFNELVADGQRHLAKAKKYHDELEAVYRPHVDFSLADRLAQEHLEMLRSIAE